MSLHFITTLEEFKVAQQELMDYIIAGRKDDDKRMEMLLAETEAYVRRETGRPTTLDQIVALPEEQREAAIEEFVRRKLNRKIH